MSPEEKIRKAVILAQIRGIDDITVVAENAVTDFDLDIDGKLDDATGDGAEAGRMVVEIDGFPVLHERDVAAGDDILDVYRAIIGETVVLDRTATHLSETAVEAIAHAWTLGFNVGHKIEDGRVVLDANRRTITNDQLNRAENVSSAYRLFQFESR